MKCPNCMRRLRNTADTCLCGWTIHNKPIKGHVDCFFAPQCTRPARLRTDRYTRPGQFQALCLQCDQRLHEEKAERWCTEHGLHTREQRIAYCLRMAGSLKLPISREPGQEC